MVVLDQIAQGVSQAGRNEVGSKSEEDGSFVAGFRVAERTLSRSIWLHLNFWAREVGKYHFIDDACRLCDRTALKPCVGQIVHHFGHCDISALEPIKIHAAHDMRSFRDRLRALEHGVRHGGRNGRVIHICHLGEIDEEKESSRGVANERHGDLARMLTEYEVCIMYRELRQWRGSC